MTLDCKTRVPVLRLGFDPSSVTRSEFDSSLRMFIQQGGASEVI